MTTAGVLPARRRSARDRLIDLVREATLSPLPRSASGGTVILVVGLVGGLSSDASIALSAATGVVLYAVLNAAVQMGRQARNTEDTHVLAALLGRHTPPLGTWAIEADFGGLVYQEMQRRPQVVVECGSGVTTLLIAACLRAQGGGRLYSLENDEHFAKVTEQRLADAGLSEWVEVIVAPLVEQRFGDTRVAWYSPEAIARIPGALDLVIVDGPPAVKRWSRLPAMEVFAERMSLGATVLLDDGRRRPERRAASRWQSEHPDFAFCWHDTVKGTWKLTKRDAPRSDGMAVAAARAVLRAVNRTPSAFGRWPVSR